MHTWVRRPVAPWLHPVVRKHRQHARDDRQWAVHRWSCCWFGSFRSWFDPWRSEWKASVGSRGRRALYANPQDGFHTELNSGSHCNPRWRLRERHAFKEVGEQMRMAASTIFEGDDALAGRQLIPDRPGSLFDQDRRARRPVPGMRRRTLHGRNSVKARRAPSQVSSAVCGLRAGDLLNARCISACQVTNDHRNVKKLG